MTKADHMQIQKAFDVVDSLIKKKKGKQTDLFYRYQGKTFMKTVDTRKALKIIFKALRNDREDIETEPFLFDCVSSGENPLDTMIPGLNEDLYRTILRSKMFCSGIKESEINTWLSELTTEKK